MPTRGIARARPCIQPGDVGLRILPADTCRGPGRRFGIGSRIGMTVAGRLPTKRQCFVARRRLIGGVAQKSEKLRRRDIEFAEREGTNSDAMLRTLRVEAPGFARRTAHHECARWNTDHQRTIRTLTKLALLVLVGGNGKADE